MTIDTSREAVEQINKELSWDDSFGAIEMINALLAERDAALAEVARLSAPPEGDGVKTMVYDLSHTGDLSMLYRCAIADALTRLSHALAAERKLADDAKRLLELAQDRCGHNFVGAEYPTFVDFCDAHAARRKEETLAEHGSKT